jgi:hypothetical protein
MNAIIHREDIVEYQEFFTKEECNLLIDFFNSSKEDWQPTCFFASYVMDPHAPIEKNTSTSFDKNYFEEFRAKLRGLSQEVTVEKLKNLSLSAHKWTPGAIAPMHSDNTEIDGTPNAWQDNKFVAIVYLNDNYSGGNLVFDKHKISISPSAGTVVAFDPGFTNLHSVSEILEGERYTILASFDHESATYERNLFEWRQEYSKEKEEQRKEWEKNNHF